MIEPNIQFDTVVSLKISYIFSLKNHEETEEIIRKELMI